MDRWIVGSIVPLAAWILLSGLDEPAGVHEDNVGFLALAAQRPAASGQPCG